MYDIINKTHNLEFDVFMKNVVLPYQKWQSFTRHFKRRHPDAVQILDDAENDIENPPEEGTQHNNISMEQENSIEEDNDNGKIIV